MVIRFAVNTKLKVQVQVDISRFDIKAGEVTKLKSSRQPSYFWPKSSQIIEHKSLSGLPVMIVHVRLK